MDDDFSSILESAMDPIVTVDAAQRIVFFNAAAEQIFGYRREEVVGQDLSLLVPERHRAAHHGYVERFAATGITRRRMGGHTVLSARRADNSEFPIEASISQTGRGDGRRLTVILRDVSERIRYESELEQSKRELSVLANAANSAREQEKMRIARELHDELAQALTALKIDVAWVNMRLSSAQDDLRERLDRVGSMLDSTVAATRRIAADLRPMLLDDLGIAAAVEWLCEDFAARTGLAVEAHFDPACDDLPDTHANAVFRVLQESLTNIARHAQAHRVTIEVSRKNKSLFMQITDDGQGFVLDEGKTGTLGLLGIRERAYMLGGTVSIDSVPGRGTHIEVRLPITEVGEI